MISPAPLPLFTQPSLPNLPCYLNGKFTQLSKAKISVMDRGFIFGDGVYEVVPVYGGVPFRFEHHMARLERSLAELRIPAPLNRSQWLAVVLRLIRTFQKPQQNGAPDGSADQLIYIHVTRGVALREHTMLPGLVPTVFAMTNTLPVPSPVQRKKGVACVTADDFRWQKAHIKATSLLGAVFARQISFDAGALETVMFRNGYLSEAAASNVWVVKDGRIIGVPKDNLVLEGIRYGLFAQLAKQIGARFELRRIRRDEVLNADELLLSSATKEVLAITRLDGHPVGTGDYKGKPGPVYARLYQAYQQAKIAEHVAFVRSLV